MGTGRKVVHYVVSLCIWDAVSEGRAKNGSRQIKYSMHLAGL